MMKKLLLLVLIVGLLLGLVGRDLLDGAKKDIQGAKEGFQQAKESLETAGHAVRELRNQDGCLHTTLSGGASDACPGGD